MFCKLRNNPLANMIILLFSPNSLLFTSFTHKWIFRSPVYDHKRMIIGNPNLSSDCQYAKVADVGRGKSSSQLGLLSVNPTNRSPTIPQPLALPRSLKLVSAAASKELQNVLPKGNPFPPQLLYHDLSAHIPPCWIFSFH